RVKTLHARPHLASSAAWRQYADIAVVGRRGRDHANQQRRDLSTCHPALAACRHRELRSHARDGEADGIRGADREFPGQLSGSLPLMSAARVQLIATPILEAGTIAPCCGLRRSDDWP